MLYREKSNAEKAKQFKVQSAHFFIGHENYAINQVAKDGLQECVVSIRKDLKNGLKWQTL